ncbi:MAG: diguanylate cyclase [Gammaproteobacteria bacterium]|nr:diguanylate cyclase [Gammaproteobacteria bacterium]
MPAAAADHDRQRSVVNLLSAVLGASLIGVALMQWVGGEAGGHWASATSAASGMVLLSLAAGVFLLSLAVFQRFQVPPADREPVDKLSGLYLEPCANEMAGRLVARDERTGRSELSLVVISVDGLEQLVERYGDDVLEAALGLVGRQVRSQVRGSDIAFRMRPYLLGVFLHCEETTQASAFGRRIAMLLSQQQLAWRGDEVKLTVSMGIVTRRAGEDLDALRLRANEMREKAEGEGGNRILT